ncbi:MAG: ribosome-associated translation inhibitor RaiA [Spirochaetales bacterium]|nr:ribosome-associated translation inhibitor RaiA [Spirochaetales bacterium]
MNLEISAIHFDVTDEIKQYVEKKLHKIEFAKEYIIDLIFKFIKEKSDYKVEANVNFRWGNSAHVEINSFDMYEGIDKLITKIEQKINKEKTKIQKHQ